MKDSEYLYGNSYNKEFMQQHKAVFEQCAIWGQETATELMNVDLLNRDMRRVNACLKAVKWNEGKLKEISQ